VPDISGEFGSCSNNRQKNGNGITRLPAAKNQLEMIKTLRFKRLKLLFAGKGINLTFAPDFTTHGQKFDYWPISHLRDPRHFCLHEPA
jgi:hypothetical protein